MGSTNVQNRTMLLLHVPDVMRGRVFSIAEALNNATMMISMSVASMATLSHGPRDIGFIAGLFSTSTAFPWAWATFRKKLPEPRREVVTEAPEELGPTVA